jgi:excisionase family DNA binding protein
MNPEQKERFDKTYMSISEVCDYLRLSRSKFAREYKKFLPFVKIGGRVIFHKSDVDEYMRNARRDERFLHN